MRPQIGHAVQTELSMRHCMAVWFTCIYDTIASGSQTSCSEKLRGILDKRRVPVLDLQCNVADLLPVPFTFSNIYLVSANKYLHECLHTVFI